MSPHDRGGWPTTEPIGRADHELADWEVLVDALSTVLAAKGLRSAHESRRAQEELPVELYESLGYYERWAVAAEAILVAKGVLRREDIDARAATLAQRWEAT